MFKPNKYTTTINFRLASVFFINLENFSHPTLVLRLSLWKCKCWLKVHRELYVKIKQWCWHTRITMHWRSCCEVVLAIEMKRKFEVFLQLWCYFNISDYYGSQVYFFCLRYWFPCMTSLAVTSSTLKNSVEFWGTFFRFWLRPCEISLNMLQDKFYH